METTAYDSPVKLTYEGMMDQIRDSHENAVYEAIVNCGINIDKDALCQALQADRRRYEAAYAKGRADALADTTERASGYWEAQSQDRFYGYDRVDGEPIWRKGWYFVCSECRKKTIIKTRFCAHCGAEMERTEAER